jgi:hypothetical protein
MGPQFFMNSSCYNTSRTMKMNPYIILRPAAAGRRIPIESFPTRRLKRFGIYRRFAPQDDENCLF